MDTDTIRSSLERLYNQDGHRLIFWNDPDRDFQTDLLHVLPAGVDLIELAVKPSLAVKILIERDKPDQKFLLYAPTEEPDSVDDWLLDIRLYSKAFRADRASLVRDQLGLTSLSLRTHIEKRRKFFDSKERTAKLRALVAPDDNEDQLDRKMLAVIVKADQPEPFALLRTLFHAYTDGRDDAEIDLDKPPQEWEHLEKFELAEPFWRTMHTIFGYQEELPSLRNLLIRLLVTDFARSVKDRFPLALENLVLPHSGRANAVVCLAQWRDSKQHSRSYDRLSELVADSIKLAHHLSGIEMEAMAEAMTFLAVEQVIASRVRDLVQSTAETINADEVHRIASIRQAGHWALWSDANNPAGKLRIALHSVYDALVAAADFFSLRNRYRDGFSFDTAGSLYRAYESELYRFDQLYRHFCEHADVAESHGWDILKELRPDVEACYCNWYVTRLALAWGHFIEPSGATALLDHWKLDDVPNQQNFFGVHVRPRLEEAENRKVFVIISDAFRFEAAQELVAELNGKDRLEAELSSQLGVLPSYTPLGMASLLPHKTLQYKENGSILADGRPTEAGDRDAVLNAVDGMACQADKLLEMKRDDGRSFINGKRVIYIYHNEVDSTGENREADTFGGVRRAINQLVSIVGYVINSLNATNVIVTADHGFLFTESAPGETDKSKIEEKPAYVVKPKKRYYIGYQLPDNDAVYHGKTKITAGAEGDMEFWIPKAANRFHFVGGARFIHGGAMPQEIIVPVITIRQLKSKAGLERTKTRNVTVHVLGANHRITTARHRFELIQMEPVSERVKPVTLKIAIFDGDDPVTDIVSVTFDSLSDQMDLRKKEVVLTLQGREYDRRKPYQLVLRDADTAIEEQRIEVIIDRAFTDDF